MNIDIALEKVFRLTAFRVGQREVIEAAVAGQDVLGVMPTGAGKSLTYQLPAVLGTGLTVVVSPLIALMRDQVASLEKLGVKAVALHSGLSEDEQVQALQKASSVKMLYLAPERLRSKMVLEHLAKISIARLVVDEAHCVSQWGHDFRPDYQLLFEARVALGNPPVTAVTATATREVQRDIALSLQLQDPYTIVTGFDRPNLAYRVWEVLGEASKLEALRDLITRMPKPGLVYAGTRREAEDLTLELRGMGVKASCYHAALETSTRNAVQDAFKHGKLEVVIATNAFGMGVDKKDVRFVIHYRIPGTLEAYYQEAGRAGRDGKPSQCWLLFDAKDRDLQAHFIETSTPTQHELKRLWAYFHAARDEQNQISIRVMDLERNLNIPSNKIRVAYNHLETVGALERLAAQAGFSRARIAETPPNFKVKALEDLKKHKTLMLEQILGFAAGKTCRAVSILEYFGETSSLKACGQCDICVPNPMPIWTRRTLEHLRGVKSDFFKKPNLVRIAKEVNPAFSNPEVEKLLEKMRLEGYLDGTQLLTPKALKALEVIPEPVKSITLEIPDGILEDFTAGMGIAALATKNGVNEDAIEKRLERALEKGELEPTGCITKSRLEQVRVIADEIGFSPLAKLSAALPKFSKLELKAARMLLE
jgi:ATP-dependent DNA helicase RecQ